MKYNEIINEKHTQGRTIGVILLVKPNSSVKILYSTKE